MQTSYITRRLNKDTNDQKNVRSILFCLYSSNTIFYQIENILAGIGTLPKGLGRLPGLHGARSLHPSL